MSSEQRGPSHFRFESDGRGKNNQARRGRAAGFTLIELMITVAIVAILSAIAIPSYSDYIRRGRITEAVSALADMRVKMEQYYQDNRTYLGACAASTIAPIPTATTSFTFACPTLTATTFQVTATGQATMAGFTYAVLQDGTRRTLNLPAGWTGASATSACWVIKKDGSC